MVSVKNYETVSKFVKIMQRKLWTFFSRTVCGGSYSDSPCMCTYVDGREVDVQYSNWRSGDPASHEGCVEVTDRDNIWRSYRCDEREGYVCQS